MMKRNTLLSLMGLQLSTPAYAAIGFDDVNGNIDSNQQATAESPIQESPIQEPVVPSTSTVQDYSVPSYECEAWMDANVNEVQQRYCVDTTQLNQQNQSALATLVDVCGTEAMQPWLNKTFAGENNTLLNFNNYSCMEIDLATATGVVIKGLCLENSSPSYVCVNGLESVTSTVVNQAPLIETLAGNFTEVANSGKNHNYIFRVTDPEGDDWTVNVGLRNKAESTATDLESSLSDEDYVIVPVTTNLEAGNYEILIRATDINGSESEILASDYTLTDPFNQTDLASDPDMVRGEVRGEVTIPTPDYQTIDFRFGYSAMFQPAFEQRSHGILTTIAIPTANGLKLVPGLRWGRLSGGVTPDSYTEAMSSIDRGGREYIESIPDPNNQSEIVDIEMQYNETSHGSIAYNFNAPSNGHDLQGQLYLEFPNAEKVFENGSLAAVLQTGIYAGKTWGQTSSRNFEAIRNYTTEASLLTVDSNGNEELLQELNPVSDIQSKNGTISQNINGYGYTGIGGRVMVDATMNNGFGIYANADFGFRMGGSGVSLDAGTGIGLVYKFPMKNEYEE